MSIKKYINSILYKRQINRLLKKIKSLRTKSAYLDESSDIYKCNVCEIENAVNQINEIKMKYYVHTIF